MKNKLITLVFSSILSICCYAQETTFKLKKSNAQVKIDGKLNEPIWENLQSFNQFYNHFPIDSGFVKKPVIAKAFHDGNLLYIGVTVFEDTPEYIVRSLKRDEGYDSFTKGDGFAIVLDIAGNQNSGYLFATNVKGAQTDGIVSISNDNYTVDSNWNTKWQSKTIIEKNKRHYEIAIPLNSLPYSTNNWKINLINIDAKTPQYSTLTSFSRNYSAIDLRFTKSIEVQNLGKAKKSKLTLIPSTVFSYNEDVKNNNKTNDFTAGIDVKYNITSTLKLEATINPDFSAIEQDDQIANLTRFDISFPERRNFFLENGDLFNNLGARNINPFYSRIIGSKTDIQFGLKLSGKVANKFRIGILNAQTESTNTTNGQNYTVAVGRRNITKGLTATGYLINRQELKKHEITNNYNRVLGLNLNYISKNNAWLGQLNFAKSLTEETTKNNDFFNATLSYSTRKWSGTTSTSIVNKNYITDVGFQPRLTNFDAILNTSTRAGYIENYTEIIYSNFNIKSDKRDKNDHKIRFSTYLNSNLKLVEEAIEMVNIFWNKDLSYYFVNFNYNHNNLQYATDILKNGKPLPLDIYNTAFVRIGYISPPTNKAFSFQNRLQYGGFYNGDRFGWELVTNYRLQPWANLSANYNLNAINLKQYGKDTIHTFNFSGSVFFNNKLSWTTIAQLNTQSNNLGYSLRLQWEFNPLSFAHLVITDNYSADNIHRENFGVALKINYWLDI
mgnify:FL=1